MGCDGGTIPRRDELVRTKKKPEQKDKDADNIAKWKHCHLSQQPLSPPIVGCRLGWLYNKDAIIEHLLKKTFDSEAAKHIKSLKDIKSLNLTENQGYKHKDADKGDEYVDHQASRYICPVVGLEMTGKHKFYFLWTCGCVMSEKAIREVKAEGCLKCSKPYTEDDIIILNGSDEEIAQQQLKMEVLKQKEKAEKKSKKRKAGDEEPSTSSAGTSGITKAKQANGMPPASKSGYATALTDKAKLSYSVAKDPKATEAFKSLFTTHKDALNQPKQHWITHNPLYY